jgi:hypothetical protein
MRLQDVLVGKLLSTLTAVHTGTAFVHLLDVKLHSVLVLELLVALFAGHLLLIHIVHSPNVLS